MDNRRWWYSHNLVTALLDKTVSIWHRDGSAAFISVFSFFFKTMKYLAASEAIVLDIFLRV